MSLAARQGRVTKDNVMRVVKNALQAACTESNIRAAAEHVGFTYTGGGEVLKFDVEAIEKAMLKHSPKYVISRMEVQPEHAKLRSRAVLEAKRGTAKISEYAAGWGFKIPPEIKIRQLMLLEGHNRAKSSQEKKSALRLAKVSIHPDRYGAVGLNHSLELKRLRELRLRRAKKLDQTKTIKEIKELRMGQADVLAVAKAICAANPKQYSLLRVGELRALLGDLNLDTKGSKDELVSRLVKHDC